MFKQSDVHQAISLRDAHALAECAERLGEISTTLHPRQGRHARVIPTFYVATLYQELETSFTEHDERDGQLGKLNLPRHRVKSPNVFDEPIVERAMILKLERAQAMSDALERIGQRMSKI